MHFFSSINDRLALVYSQVPMAWSPSKDAQLLLTPLSLYTRSDTAATASGHRAFVVFNRGGT